MENDGKKKSKMSKVDRIISGIAITLVVMSAGLAAACIYYSHLVQGVLIIVCDIAIVGVLLIASGGKSKKRNQKFDVGAQFITCNEVNWAWSQAIRAPKMGKGASSKVTFGHNGICFKCEMFAKGYTWDEVCSYQLDDDRLTMEMADASRLMLLYLKPLKVRAIAERLQKQGVVRLHV